MGASSDLGQPFRSIQTSNKVKSIRFQRAHSEEVVIEDKPVKGTHSSYEMGYLSRTVY